MIELLISILVFLLIACIILWFVHFIVSNLPISPTIRNLIVAIVALILLLYFLQRQGWVF